MLAAMLEQSPDDAALQLLEAGRLLKEGTTESIAAAESTLGRVVELDPRNVDAHLRLIGLARGRGDVEESADRVARALGANPGDRRLLLARASLEAEAGRSRVAQELARGVLEEHPDDAMARVLLAELALRADDPTEAQTLAEQVVALDPSNETGQDVYARALAAQGQRGRALEALEAFRQTPTGQRSARTHIHLAALYQQDGRWDVAGERLDQAAALAPDAPAWFVARLRWLAGQGRFADLSSALKSHPGTSLMKDPAVILAAADLLSRSPERNHQQESLALLAGVAASDPTLIDAHLAVARVAYRLGDGQRTLEAYRQVLTLEPYHPQALNDMAWILGVERGSTAEAMALADRGIARYPDDPHLLDTRGVLLTQLGRLAEARSDLEACIEATDDQPATRARALIHLARVEVEDGQAAAARRHLDVAEAIDEAQHVLSEEDRHEIQSLRATPP
jgi:tetratricopeptide (TPR) repeat protein